MVLEKLLGAGKFAARLIGMDGAIESSGKEGFWAMAGEATLAKASKPNHQALDKVVEQSLNINMVLCLMNDICLVKTAKLAR